MPGGRQVRPEYPVTVNDAEPRRGRGGAAELFGPERVQPLDNPVMGSEDFSRVLAEVPRLLPVRRRLPG